VSLDLGYVKRGRGSLDKINERIEIANYKKLRDAIPSYLLPTYFDH